MEENKQSTKPKDLLGLYKPYSDLVAANKQIEKLERKLAFHREDERKIRELLWRDGHWASNPDAVKLLMEINQNLHARVKELDAEVDHKEPLGTYAALRARVAELEAERDDFERRRDQLLAAEKCRTEQRDKAESELAAVSQERDALKDEVAILNSWIYGDWRSAPVRFKINPAGVFGVFWTNPETRPGMQLAMESLALNAVVDVEETMIRHELETAQARVVELEAERDDLRESRDHYQTERDGLQKRNDIQAGQLKHIDGEISPLMSEVARLKQELETLKAERDEANAMLVKVSAVTDDLRIELASYANAHGCPVGLGQSHGPCPDPSPELITAIENDEVERENDGFLTDVCLAIKNNATFTDEQRTNFLAELIVSQRMYRDMTDTAMKLAAFKKYVHKRLDDAGVPANPEPPVHALEGCRVGDRLDWLLHDTLAEFYHPSEHGEWHESWVAANDPKVVAEKHNALFRDRFNERTLAIQFVINKLKGRCPACNAPAPMENIGIDWKPATNGGAA